MPVITGLLCFVVFGLISCTDVKEDRLQEHQKEVFINVTEKAALNFVRDSYSHCWGDVNGDGLPDLFVVNHISLPSLFINNGNGTFKDVTKSSGVNIRGDLHGCAIADYDNDGDQDIYVTQGAQKGKGLGPNILYQNKGKAEFNDVASAAGVTDPKGRGRSASWVDYNSDGYLDLFIANDKRDDAPSALFKNNSDGTFTEVAVGSGLNIIDHLLEASWVDYDNDGFMDLTSVCYRKRHQWEISIYRNLQNGTFKKTETFWGSTYAWGDYDNDGDMDLFISSTPRVQVLGYEFSQLSLLFKGDNKLFENIGRGKFIDVSDKVGISKEMGGNKAIFFDFDNDGFLDIYLLVSGTIDNNINDMIFRNKGDKTFGNITREINLVQNFKGRGCGVAYADYDNDGFLDLFLTNGQGPYRDDYIMGRDAGTYVLYKNNGNNNRWLKIKLTGRKSNRDAIGARITLNLGGHRQYRQDNGGMEGLVQNSNVIHFGLGNADVVDEIEVKWPSGATTRMTKIKSNQTLLVSEE
jgi:hypothetical protein